MMPTDCSHQVPREAGPTCVAPEPLQADADLPQRLLGRVEGDGLCARLLNVDLQVVLQVLPNSWHRKEWLGKMADTGVNPWLWKLLSSPFCLLACPGPSLDFVSLRHVFCSLRQLLLFLQCWLKPPALSLYSSHSGAFDQPSKAVPSKGRAHSYNRYYTWEVSLCVLARLTLVSSIVSPSLLREKQSQQSLQTLLKLMQDQGHTGQSRHRLFP